MENVSVLQRPWGRGLIPLTLLVLLLFAVQPALAQTTRIIFLHHSCGANLIEQGGVREGLTALGYEFYDHGYNDEGLRLADGSYTGTNFDVPGDNTDPDGYAAIFAQPLHEPPDNTFSYLMQYDVIAFKSCFPVSNIGDDAQLAEYQSYYLAIRDRMDQYPEKIFIIVTQPPQVPGSSDSSEAARARTFANWLQSDEYLSGHPNIFVFDFFGLLAGDDNFLHSEYRVDNYDAHPNDLANATIGPLFVTFIDDTINSYSAGGPRPTTDAPPPPPTAEIAPPLSQPGVSQPADGLIDDFETTTEPWHASSDRPETVIECGADSSFFHQGAASLRIHYTIASDGYADCGDTFDPPQDWSSGTGLSMWLLAEQAGQQATFMVFSGSSDNPTPFELPVETTAESMAGWVQLTFAWSDFTRSPWADTGGLSELDPTRMTGYAFSFGAGGSGLEGIIWIDDVALVGASGPPPAGSAAEPAATDSVSADATAAPTEAAESGGGICGGAAIILPLGAACVALFSLRRKQRES